MPPQRKQRGGRKRHTPLPESSPLDDFFAKYYPFEYDRTESASHEFYRLCNESRWERYDPEREEAHQAFRDALVQQFNQAYGTDEDSLPDWQNLCYIVHIDPAPEDLDACREAVSSTFVNIVDLVDTKITGDDVEVFDSEVELSEYTRDTGKFFPRENAYAGGLLRYLLRHILNPGTGVSSSRRRTKRRR